MGLPHRGYSISAGSDADTENEAVMSPEHAMRLWGRGVKSGRSSCLSSRSNSALTLTDTEHENKSDSENGKFFFLWLRNVGVQCFCLFPLTLEAWLASFLPSLLLLLSSSFLCIATLLVALKKCPSLLHFFSLGKNQYSTTSDCKIMQAFSVVLAILLKNSLIVIRKKKPTKIGFDLSWTVSPVILDGVAKQVVVKFTPQPACNQRCLCPLENISKKFQNLRMVD